MLLKPIGNFVLGDILHLTLCMRIVTLPFILLFSNFKICFHIGHLKKIAPKQLCVLSSSYEKTRLQTRHTGFLNFHICTIIYKLYLLYTYLFRAKYFLEIKKSYTRNSSIFFVPINFIKYNTNLHKFAFFLFVSKIVSLSDVTAHITPTSVTSPVATAANITTSAPKSASSDPDVAFPAVLKGSQKQRVPPPVPPRGSPKAKRGGGNSQSTVDKGEYTINISVNDIPPQTPITSSDDDFVFYGHDFKFKQSDACKIVPSISDTSVKITKLVSSNSFLEYVEEADSITERSYPGKELIAQTNMMAKFTVDKIVTENLDSGEYEGTSFTESSSEDGIVTYRIKDEVYEEKKNDHNKSRQLKSPSQFIKGVVNQIGEKLSIKSPTKTDTLKERASVHNVKSSDLIFAAKTLKKTTKSENLQKELEKEAAESKNVGKSGIISGISKKLNFNQSKRDKNRSQDKKPVPKIEIKTYSEEHSKGINKEDIVCHKKATTNIDMFQKHIWKVQSDSENSSRRSSFSSSQDSQRSHKFELKKQVLVKETKKKLLESIEFSQGSTSSTEKIALKTDMKPKLSKVTGNVHDKIKKFSEATALDVPKKVPRKKKSSFKKRSEKKKIFKINKDIEEVL